MKSFTRKNGNIVQLEAKTLEYYTNQALQKAKTLQAQVPAHFIWLVRNKALDFILSLPKPT